MTSWRRYAGNDRGSVIVETALMVPVIFFVMWVTSTVAYTWRLEGSVHRATAAVADILANQRMSNQEELTTRLERVSSDIGSIFLEMVTGEEETSSSTGTQSSTTTSLRAQMQYGLRITYYNTSTSTESSWSVGGLTVDSASTSLSTLGQSGAEDSLVTSTNYGTLELVRVESKVSYPGMVLGNLVLPGEFSSSFVAVRREY